MRKSSQWIGGVLVGSLLTLVLVFGFGLLRPQPAVAGPVAVKWEYQISNSGAVSEYNRLGNQGWEMIHVSQDNGILVIFKRRK